MSQRAAATAEEMKSKLDEVNQAARSGLGDVSRKLHDHLAEAASTAECLREECNATAGNLAVRSQEAREQAEQTLERAEKAVSTLSDQSRGALGEVRSALAQMQERAGLLQSDLVRLGVDVREAADSGVSKLRDAASGVTAHVESLRESARKDADADHRRLSSLKEQVERGAEQIRINAGKLLDQVQAGTGAMREHADELLAQAQTGSDRIGQQAAQCLAEAHAASERFRQQAELLLERAEKTGEAVRADVHGLRDEIVRDADRVRSQISGARREITESRSEAAGVLDKATEAHQVAQRRSDDLMRRAEQIGEESRELLRMPREILDEAHRNAESLSAMSGKVSKIVHKLTELTHKAESQTGKMEAAKTSADERLDNLKRQTARVGQLVGIIRQLYGAMDTRVENLRDKLGRADELCRTVPQEIDALKAALGAPPDGNGNGKRPPGSEARSAKPDPAVDAKKADARKPAPAPKAPRGSAAASLAQVAKRNQKLNEWLRKTLGDVEASAAARQQSPAEPTAENEPAEAK